jgi:hypothetical protein
VLDVSGENCVTHTNTTYSALAQVIDGDEKERKHKKKISTGSVQNNNKFMLIIIFFNRCMVPLSTLYEPVANEKKTLSRGSTLTARSRRACRKKRGL